MNIPPNDLWGDSPEAGLLLWRVRGCPMDYASQWNILELHEVAAWLQSQESPVTDLAAERIEALADQYVSRSRIRSWGIVGIASRIAERLKGGHT